jgi:hypothetical protein
MEITLKMRLELTPMFVLIPTIILSKGIISLMWLKWSVLIIYDEGE